MVIHLVMHLDPSLCRETSADLGMMWRESWDYICLLIQIPTKDQVDVEVVGNISVRCVRTGKTEAGRVHFGNEGD